MKFGFIKRENQPIIATLVAATLHSIRTIGNKNSNTHTHTDTEQEKKITQLSTFIETCNET